MNDVCQTEASPSAKVSAGSSMRWLPALAILALTLVAYVPVLKCGFIWDDDSYVTSNQTLRTVDGLRRIWCEIKATPQYYPLVHTSFWLEYHLWGLKAAGFHLTNVLLHGLAAILLWRVLLRLELRGALIAALIFAVHPVHVESVAWITERKNVLSAVFYFSSALCYLRFANFDGKQVFTRRWSFYFAAFGFFVAALLSKTVACSLPAAILLVCWWKRGRLQRSDILPLLPLFAVGIGLGLLTAWLEKHHVGAGGTGWSFTFADRCLIAGRAVWFYLGKLLLPTSLTFIYPRWVINRTELWQWIFPLAAIATVSSLWSLRRRFGRGPLVATLFFIGTLGPALGFIDVYPMKYSFVADHFQYIASIGVIVLVAAAFQRLPNVVQYAMPLLLAGLTWHQTAIYRDLETLWQDTLAKNPNAFLAHNNLAEIFLSRSERDKAISHIKAGLTLEPNNADLHYNYGFLLEQQSNIAEAVGHYRECVRIKTNHVAALHNLAWHLATSSDQSIRNGKEAFELAKRACELTNYEDIRCFDALDAAFAEIGDFPKAIAIATEARERAATENNMSLRDAADQRIHLYNTGMPYRSVR